MSSDKGPIETPFVILIDSNEGHPFTFRGFHSDSKDGYRPVIVRTATSNLGRYPASRGDYSIYGLRGVSVERKSMEDIQSTVLGWTNKKTRDKGGAGRRQRFESELANLNELDSAIVIIEATFGNCLREMPEYGVKSADLNKKIFERSIISFQQRFPRVQWHWADSRRQAEVYCFDFLHRYWRENERGQGCDQGCGQGELEAGT